LDLSLYDKIIIIITIPLSLWDDYKKNNVDHTSITMIDRRVVAVIDGE
jgi:hypothetical protein